MDVKIALPDDLALSLSSKWGNLERRLLEMAVIEAYREGAISAGKLGEILGLSTRLEVDAFLKAREIYLAYNEADLEADRHAHEQLQQTGKHDRP